ncbi:MAG: hypothetical protein OZ929_23350 [Bryobacterales bacterium]|nr:hypothetical protein [Bryobacterales bacterium]
MDLPVKVRNPFTHALLDPAVVSRYTAEQNPFFMWSPSHIGVGGNTTTKNDLLLDGAPIQVGPKDSYSPPMDAVQEFPVQQNSVDAEFGHSATMITDLQRIGDFSRTLTKTGVLKTIYDPTTTVLDVANNTSTRMPFPGNIISQSRFDPTSKRILQDLWGPNRRVRTSIQAFVEAHHT